MKRFALLALVLSAAAHSAPPATETIQWSLRFNELRAHPSAMTGCYGTASYEYVLPSVEVLQENREALLKRAKDAKLDGFAFSRENSQQDPGNTLVVDLVTGDVKSIPRYMNFGRNKGVVFCQCRVNYLKNCSRSGVPALGQPFLTATTVKPQPVGISWQDPLTTITWTYRSPGMNWKKAKAACTADGGRLPSLEELQVAQRRLVQSPAGHASLKAGQLVWSSTPGHDVVPQAWAMWLTNGNARWVQVQNPLPVICATGTAP